MLTDYQCDKGAEANGTTLVPSFVARELNLCISPDENGEMYTIFVKCAFG